MYKLTEEMMARLKSLDFKLTFDISYNTHPITIKYKGKKVKEINLIVNHTDQKEEITFDGFDHRDSKQKVSCTMTYNNNKLNLDTIASLVMTNNKLVKNENIVNVKDVYFNGVLNLRFFKDWFKHHILLGANMDDDYVSWQPITFTDEDIFCVGDSFTLGNGVAINETWPSMLNGNVCNFGSNGLSHDGCLKNVKYILERSDKVKQIICLLPSPTRKLFNFEFLNHRCTIPITINSPSLSGKKTSLPQEYTEGITKLKNYIVNGDINKDWIKTCDSIIDLCDKHNVNCWLSTWDHTMYRNIPRKNRLPVFPKIDTFEERAIDGHHPHKKHYELYVKNITPYVDKT